MVRLTVKTGERSQVVETRDAPIIIGRSVSNTVHITDDQSSRQHCRIERTEAGGYRLTDLASRNGTYLNKRLVGESPLLPGDEITIGTTTITFELAGEAAAAAAEAPLDHHVPDAIRLVFVAGANEGLTRVLAGKITTLGRSPRNDIPLNDGGVSNRHVEIRRGPEGFVLVDIGSKNGTFLNGHLVTRSPIAPGDEIRIGKSTVQVQPASGPPVAAAEPPAEAPPEAKTAPTARIEAEKPAEPEPTAPADAGAPAEPEPGRALWRIAVPVAAVLAVAAAAGFTFRHHLADWLTASRRAAAPRDAEAPAGSSEDRQADPDARQADPSRPDRPRPPERSPEEVGRKAGDDLQAARRLLDRAALTGEPGDFGSAQKGLEALQAAARGTPQEKDVAEALALCETRRQAAAAERRQVAAGRLLRAARDHRQRNEPHIARLCCREILDQFPGTPAATEAEALLAALDKPAPAAPAAPDPAPPEKAPAPPKEE